MDQPKAKKIKTSPTSAAAPLPSSQLKSSSSSSIAASSSAVISSESTQNETSSSSPSSTSPPTLSSSLSKTSGLFAAADSVPHQVIYFQQKENKALKKEIRSLNKDIEFMKSVKVTGPNGSPVYASGLIDRDGFACGFHLPNMKLSWRVRFTEHHNEFIPLEAVPKLELCLCGVQLKVGRIRFHNQAFYAHFALLEGSSLETIYVMFLLNGTSLTNNPTNHLNEETVLPTFWTQFDDGRATKSFMVVTIAMFPYFDGRLVAIDALLRSSVCADATIFSDNHKVMKLISLCISAIHNYEFWQQQLETGKASRGLSQKEWCDLHKSMSWVNNAFFRMMTSSILRSGIKNFLPSLVQISLDAKNEDKFWTSVKAKIESGDLSPLKEKDEVLSTYCQSLVTAEDQGSGEAESDPNTEKDGSDLGVDLSNGPLLALERAEAKYRRILSGPTKWLG